MLDIVVPPNLYSSFQIFGLMVFPRVPDYSVTSNEEIHYRILGFEFGEDYVSPNQSKIFHKLGFSNSLLINIPLVIISHLIWLFLLFITFVFMKVSNNPSIKLI